MRPGDLDRPDRRWKVGPRAHPIPDLVEVVPQIGLELAQRLPIHPWGALVGLDLPPRLPDHRLGNRKRLVLRLWHVHLRFLPEPHGSGLSNWTFLVSRPLRSTATPASSSFSANTGRSASERRDQYSMPRVSALGTLPLATFWGLRPRSTLSTLAFSRSVQEPQTRITPPLRRTPPGQEHGHPPSFIPEEPQGPPVSMPSVWISTPQQRTPPTTGNTGRPGCFWNVFLVPT